MPISNISISDTFFSKIPNKLVKLVRNFYVVECIDKFQLKEVQFVTFLSNDQMTFLKLFHQL